jgi:hypothetical protein
VHRNSAESHGTDRNAGPGQTTSCYGRGTQLGAREQRTIRRLQDGQAQVERYRDSGEIVWASPMWITYQP